MISNKLADALFTITQQKVLGLLYLHPGQSYYLNEILRETGMGVATIKRELDRMFGTGIVKMTKIGNQHHYQANPDNPIFKELLSIVRKTFGFSDIIANALEPLSKKIAWSFVFGSMASGKEALGSDIDLMIIGDVSFSEVVSSLYQVQEEMSQEINPKIYSTKEWAKMVDDKNIFAIEVLSKPKINIIGKGNESR